MKIRLLWVFIVVITVATGIIGCGKPNKAVDVAINLQNASNVGSLQVELSYDARVLKATEVEAEELGEDAMIEFNIDTPGSIIIGIVDSSGISGNGPVASVSFDVLDNEAESPLNISNTQAHDVNTLVDLPVNAEEGSFAAGKVIVPLLNFQ